jgi:predicted transport protein
MTDLRLFRIAPESAQELTAQQFAYEKDVQRLFEQHMETLVGARFVKTEHITGKKHQGRIDTLGLDENSCPVIVEYKLHQNENVISQGLYYLDWLLDHRAEFEQLANGRLRPTEEVDWSGPRVLCVAEDFTKYDAHAVEQIGRNIELIRYRLYGDLLLLELVNTPAPVPRRQRPVTPVAGSPESDVAALQEALESRIFALGDDVSRKQLKLYVAYQRLKNIACVIPQKRRLLVYLRVRPSTVSLQDGFSKDVSNVSHWGTGDLELRIESFADIERAMPLLQRSYEGT